ncbi:TetR/AcrR family transcriptional regulator [Microbacterium sp. 18062]|uniref:TetR/AcrR family transcriptional regulator n=1 Tax=Microbacterium sp. 18062 TaxID=2681410 RepID=UPI00135982B8|nr:TetR/AcrR family transcriptional regulator [Microbacterium sp. 18062]
MDLEVGVSDPPPRGTRPRDRKAMIVRTAGRLFGLHGYSAVAMRDIAEALNVRASALYRHVPGKAALLLAATRAGLDPLLDSARSATALDSLLGELAAVAVRERNSGLLWVREYRHLDAPKRLIVENSIAELIDLIAAAIARESAPSGIEPHSRARAIVMLLASISFHYFELPDDRMEVFVRDSARRIVDASVRGTRPPVVEVAPHDHAGRRAELLTRAVELFADRGYAEVSVEQIAGAAGIVASSFYNHFASKRDVLGAAFAEGEVLLRAEVDRAVIGEPDDVTTLDRLLDGYIGLLLARPDLITIVVNDAFELDQSDRLNASRIHDELVDRWSRYIETATGSSAVEARIRSDAAFLLVYGLMLWPPRPSAPDVDVVHTLASTVLRADNGNTGTSGDGVAHGDRVNFSGTLRGRPAPPSRND